MDVNNFLSELNANLATQEDGPISATVNDYRYRIYSYEDGFYAYLKRKKASSGYPQDNTWEHLEHGYFRPEDDQVFFEADLEGIRGAHAIKKAGTIRFMRERFAICDTAGAEIGEFFFSEHDTTLNVTFQDTLDAYKLTDIILNSTNWDKNPEDYGYKLIASDGYGVKVYSWARLAQGYWIWEEQMTNFDVASTGKNKIKDLAKIQLKPLSEINEEEQ